MGIPLCQPLGEGGDDLWPFIMLGETGIQQVEPADDGMDGPGTGLQDIFQAIVGAACIKQSVGIEREFMTEVVGTVLVIASLDKQVAVGLRLWVFVGDVGYYIDTATLFKTLIGTGKEFLTLRDELGAPGTCIFGP